MSKTVIITGVLCGFGRETAKIFQQQGGNVVATMRSPETEQGFLLEILDTLLTGLVNFLQVTIENFAL